MVDYGGAIKRPFSDLKKLLIGIVIQLIPVVNFMALGYQLRCAKTAMEKKFELPEWEDWGNLFVKGLMAAVIGVIYMLPALIVFILTAGAVFTAFYGGVAAGQADAATMFMGSMGVGVIVALILMLIATYVLPSAILSFVSSDSLGAAFSFGGILKKAFTVKYLTVWIIMMAYGFVLSMVLSVIPVLGTAIGGFMSAVTAMTAFGELYPEL